MAWAAAIPMMVQAGTSIAGALMSDRDAFDETRVQDQVNALEASRVYEEAAINPASPHFKALRALQEAEIKRNILKGIDLLVRSQNRNRARGVMGLLSNPERRDESIAGAIGNMFAASGDQAGRGAQESLVRAASSAKERARGFSDINTLLRGYADTAHANRMRGLEGINELAGSTEVKDALTKLFGSGSSGSGGSIVQFLHNALGGPYAGGSGPAAGSFRAAQQAGIQPTWATVGNQIKTQFVSR